MEERDEAVEGHGAFAVYANWWLPPWGTQRAQDPLMKEYALNDHVKAPII